jgi:hypothetical protein
MKRILIFSALALVYCSVAFASPSECVLPIADGGDRKPSPPSITGVIASVDKNHMTFKGREDVQIQFNEKTEMFIVYGGHVRPHDLKMGLHAFVWLVGCKPASGKKALAAVIQVCATEPVPCLK